jgi:hypothetical protein
LGCETLVKNTRNLKPKKILGGIKWLKCPNPLFVGAKTFMNVANRGDAFLIYILSSPDVESHPHEIPS